ncbi:hypothetical protein [Microvirga aerophila]|uniref:DUF5681 domain-containing protein n=1 Tax=Microvirga aerophila TaxID=670291 RepID=A0A512BZR9_9HYPH|nr:hypothetical protein [Microvirga aerophila]GEO17452.1 hypothetical protein MAE02_51480 [Microvirga aerophila]
MNAKKSKGNQMTRRGGKRAGAGRPSGRRNKATVEQKLTLEELARAHTDTALAVLVEVAQHGQSEAARVSAANSILDRGYGKARLLEPEVISPAAKAEQDAEEAAKAHAEFMQFLDESLATYAAREEERSQGQPGTSEAGALS